MFSKTLRLIQDDLKVFISDLTVFILHRNPGALSMEFKSPNSFPEINAVVFEV